MASSGVEPNAENKLFVGGCPPTSNELDLRQLFEKHGVVEEVFVMRGGSRSGMACAFVRFQTQEMAQQAIDAIHGQHTLPDSAEPLVVRWADTPGSRKKDGRDGGRKSRGQGAGRGGAYGGPGVGFGPYGGFPMQQMMMMQQQQQQMGAMHPHAFYPPNGMQAGGGFGGGPAQMMGYPPMMPQYMGQQGMNMPQYMHQGMPSGGPPSPQQQQHMAMMMAAQQSTPLSPGLMEGVGAQQANYPSAATTGPATASSV